MRSLALRVLGEFDVDGVEPHSLGSRKARLLLRLLALGRGNPVPADVLTEALWGDAPPASPADQLAVLVSRLRRVLGRERLEYSDGGYRLHYDWLDVDELARLADEAEQRGRSGNVVGAVAAARAALSLVRGELTGLPPRSDWAAERAADVSRLVRRSRRTAAAALLAAGKGLEAADLASAELERDPYDEDALRTLMRALRPKRFGVGRLRRSAASAGGGSRRRPDGRDIRRARGDPAR